MMDAIACAKPFMVPSDDRLGAFPVNITYDEPVIECRLQFMTTQSSKEVTVCTRPRRLRHKRCYNRSPHLPIHPIRPSSKKACNGEGHKCGKQAGEAHNIYSPRPESPQYFAQKHELKEGIDHAVRSHYHADRVRR